MRFRQPIVITAEQFEKQKPTAGWSHIKNCILDGIDEVHFHSKGEADDYSKIKEVYVPVYSDKTFGGEKANEKTINALILTSDPKMLDALREAGNSLEAAKGTNDEKALAAMMKNVDKLMQRRDVEGMALSGLESIHSDEKAQINKNDATLAPDFVTLKEGKKPSLLTGFGMTLCGGLLIGAQVFYYIVLRRR